MSNIANRKSFNSQSEADLSLASQIAHALSRKGVPVEKIPASTERIFNQSGLARREKWRNRADYRQSTIQKALSSLSSPFYQANDHYSERFREKYFEKDLKNAHLFTDAFSGKLMFVGNFKQWFFWDENIWKVCEHGQEIRAAEEICLKLIDHALMLHKLGHPDAKRLVREAQDAHRLPRIEAMLKLASRQEGIAHVASELDADPYLLGVRNGVVDIKSNTLLKATPEMRITKQCNAAYTDDPCCPNWERFLFQVFEGDTETIRTIQILLGCTLIGQVIDEIIIICFGSGANGKSVLNNVVDEIFGDYAKTAPSSLLARRRNDDHSPRNDIAHARGARYLSVNELQAGDRLDEQVVKSLAGREPISARFLYGEFFTFSPSFTAWVRTNHKPIITGDDIGIWRRIVMVPFNRTFTAIEQDPNLEEKLLLERDGILGWMLEGAIEYRKNGIYKSPRVRAEGNAFRSESDLLGEFLEDTIEMAADQRILQAGLYAIYRDYCNQNGLYPHSKKTFTQRLAERAILGAKSGNERYYVGIKLKPRDTQPC